MKKITILIVLGILFSAATFAQVKRSKPSKTVADTTVASADPLMTGDASKTSRKDKRAMMKDLNLSKQQMKQLKELKQSGKSQKEAIEGNTQLTDEQKKQQLKELKKNQLKKTQQILTPEQIQKLKEVRKQKSGDKVEMDELEVEEMK